MNMSKKKILLYVVLPAAIAVALLTALIIVIVSGGSDGSNEDVSDALADFSLDSVTEDDIIKNNTYVARKENSTVAGNKSGVEDSELADVDYDNCSFTCKSINGFKTVSATQVTEDTVLVLNITSSNSSGNGKIAIIQNDQIIDYIPLGEDFTRTYNVRIPSTIIAKIICEDAKADITVTRSFNTRR